jgi:hypothetical protein
LHSTWWTDQLTAFAIMSYVVGHVSAPAYGYANEIAHDVGAQTAEQILSSQAGICGSAAIAYAGIAARLGLETRSVQFYYPAGDSHVAVEVRYGGSWHYYDPTWGAVYLQGDDVLGIEEARALPDPALALHSDTTLFWAAVMAPSGYPNLEAMTDPATRVEIGAQPLDG